MTKLIKQQWMQLSSLSRITDTFLVHSSRALSIFASTNAFITYTSVAQKEKGLAMSTDKTGQCVLPEQKMQKEPQGLHTTTGVRGDSRDHVIHSWQKLPSCVSHTLMRDKLAPTWQIIKQHNNEQCYMQVDLHQWDHESAGSNKKLRIALSVCPVPGGDGV